MFRYLFFCPGDLGAVWYGNLSNIFQFLNNITHTFIHFSPIYIKKNTNNVAKIMFPNALIFLNQTSRTLTKRK